MFARLVMLLLLTGGCVDLARPPMVTTDGPVLPARDGPEGGTADRAVIDSPPAETDPEPDAPAADVDEPEGPGPDVMPDAPLVVNGQPCSEGSQCASGACVDGVCCNEACTAVCFACNLAGAAGTCTAVPPGNDPRGSCAQSEASTCGLDGSCDGAGACRRYPVDTVCAPGTCTDNVEYAARTCDGAGTCRPVGVTRACSPGVCMGSSCASTCTRQDQCLAGYFCDGTRCTAKRAAGSACDMTFQCTSGYCVDGVCCNSQCGDTCQACNVTGMAGTCTPVPDGQDPRNQCPAESAGCGRAGGCNGAGACRLKTAGTTCGASSCSGATEITASTCNGLGVCNPGSPRSCIPYVCAATVCGTSCSTNDQCYPAFQCAAPACVRIPGLALFWRFDEATGTVALDSSGNNHHGTYLGPPAPSTTLPPLNHLNTRSRSFSMVDRHAVTLTDAPAVLRPGNELTLSVWFKTTGVDQNGGTPIGSELISMANNYLLRLRPDGVECTKRTAGGTVQCRSQGSQPGIFNDGWHHVAAVYGATEGVKLYLDGVSQACQVAGAGSNTASITYTGDDLFVGRHGGAETQWDFGGNLDEVRIYTRALSAAEVTALAQGRNAP